MDTFCFFFLSLFGCCGYLKEGGRNSNLNLNGVRSRCVDGWRGDTLQSLPDEGSVESVLACGGFLPIIALYLGSVSRQTCLRYPLRSGVVSEIAIEDG